MNACAANISWKIPAGYHRVMDDELSPGPIPFWKAATLHKLWLLIYPIDGKEMGWGSLWPYNRAGISASDQLSSILMSRDPYTYDITLTKDIKLF